ncbi:MAG: response regulator transcription factor [Bacteroidia bacterium]|nr:response regulator transcription factor [Bacteroidia bacterium]
MIDTILVDNEEHFIIGFSKLLKNNLPEINIVATANTIADAVELVKENKPRLVFLDIEMNNETGFDLFKHFKKIDFDIIFVTSHDEFAIKAIKYAAFDYILKPVDVEELRLTIDRLISKEPQKISQNNEMINLLLDNFHTRLYKKIALSASKGLRIVQIDKIERCHADASYSYVFLSNKEKITVSKNLTQIEELLPEDIFIRCHKSYLVNINFIKEYSYEDGGTIVMMDAVKIPVSVRKREYVVNIIKKL